MSIVIGLLDWENINYNSNSNQNVCIYTDIAMNQRKKQMWLKQIIEQNVNDFQNPEPCVRI